MAPEDSGVVIDVTSESIEQRRGAIVLCGGKSSRMRTDKVWLPFGSETMLGRVVRLLSEVVDLNRIVVVAAGSQQLPDLPAEVVVARDEVDYCGPLAGLSVGMGAMASRGSGKSVDVIFATSCDVPLLAPAFVRRMFDLLGDSEIAIPYDGERLHPLTAVYRTSLRSRTRQLLDDGRRSLRSLSEVSRVHTIPVDSLRVVDAALRSLTNLNTPDDYRIALAASGLSLPSTLDDDTPPSRLDATEKS